MILPLFLMLLFFIFQGLFAGLETGMVSIRRPRIERAAESGSYRAKLVLFFLNRPGKMITTTLIGVNVCIVCASLSAKAFGKSLGISGGTGLFLMTCFLSVAFLMVEIIPKSLFRKTPCERCTKYVFLLYATYLLLYGPVLLFDSISNFLGRFLAGKKHPSDFSSAAHEDMRLFLKESENGGGLPAEDAELLNSVLVSHACPVTEIMTPRTKVFDVSPDLAVDAAMRLCREKNVRCLPVRRSEEDPLWTGVFSSLRVLFTLPESEWKKHTVKEYMQTLRSVESNKNLLEALLRTKNVPASLFAVTRGNVQIGVFSSSDIARKLF